MPTLTERKSVVEITWHYANCLLPVPQISSERRPIGSSQQACRPPSAWHLGAEQQGDVSCTICQKMAEEESGPALALSPSHRPVFGSEKYNLSRVESEALYRASIMVRPRVFVFECHFFGSAEKRDREGGLGCREQNGRGSNVWFSIEDSVCIPFLSSQGEGERVRKRDACTHTHTRMPT